MVAAADPVRSAPTRSAPVYIEPVRSAPAYAEPAQSTSAPRTSAPSTSAPSTPAPSTTAAEGDALAFLDAEDDSPLESAPVDLDDYASRASAGSLTRSDIMALELVGTDSSEYTRSRALLLMNAQRDGDESAAKMYLDQLMLKPENRYNPIYLTELSRHYINRGSYQRALENADLAERYWARLPSELIFDKKAEIYEIQAASYQGLFYDSQDDRELLYKSIRHWEKYREHVDGRSSALTARADAELAKLEDIRLRLEY